MSRPSTMLAVLSVWAAQVSFTAADTWYVDDDNCPGPGSGSQADPFCSIQDAINAASGTDEVIVAPGTYGPMINLNGKAITVRSSDGPGVTTIDGGGSLYSMVTCDSGEGPDTVLEGFTVTGGIGLFGNGMFNNNASSPTVVNCTFTGMSLIGNGGGMRNSGGSNPTVTNCTFSGNQADNGGGMYNDGGSNPTVIDCIFSGNQADNDGGGMYNLGTSPTVINGTFSGNIAVGDGGGVYNDDGSNPTVANCVFYDNEAYIGGGMGNADNTEVTVTNCTFNLNTGTVYGGGMWNTSSTATVVGCTFAENSVSVMFGGGMYNLAADVTVTNCIFWNNTDSGPMDESAQIDGGTAVVNYSCVLGGWTGAGGTGNIASDPLFADADLRLGAGSPCIDAGHGLYGLPVDLDKQPRAVDDPAIPDTGAGPVTFLDMGAYEWDTLAADLDGDGDVDLADFAEFMTLFSGPTP